MLRRSTKVGRLFCWPRMGSNPKGREAEEMRKHLPAQRARREAPQRPPAQQADPLTAHQSNPVYLQIESALWIGEAVRTLFELLLVCLHAALEFFRVLGRRQILGDNSAVEEAAAHTCVVFDVLLLDLV